ncbi:MAG: hypothetical protein ACYTHM_01760 [Planctomycetota bacterium]|jgi:hypothetical protein
MTIPDLEPGKECAMNPGNPKRFHWVLFVIAAAGIGLGMPDPAWCGEGGEATETLCRFEAGAKDKKVAPAKSRTAVVGNAAEGEKCLQWSIAEGSNWYALYIEMDMDLTKCMKLSLHLRADEPLPAEEIVLRLKTSNEDYFSLLLPRVGTEWKHFVFPFLAFRTSGKPDAKAVKTLAFVGFRSRKPITLYLDQIAVVKSPKGWDGALAEKMDFEDPGQVFCAEAGRSTVAPEPGESGTCLAWKIPEGRRSAWLDLSLIPRDIRWYSHLRFRLHAERPVPTEQLVIRFYDQGNNYLGIYLKEVPKGWSTVTVPLGYMWTAGAFDPQGIDYLEWLIFRPEAATLRLDDVELVTGPNLEASWRTGSTPKIDFNDPDRLFTVLVDNSRIHLAKIRRKKTALEWNIPAGKEWVRLMILSVPEDIRSYGAIRFVMMANRKVEKGELDLKIGSSPDDYLSCSLPALETRWSKVEITLPECRPHKSVDPTRIRTLRIVGWDLKAVTLRIQGLEFVKGKRKLSSWKPTEKELTARIFGASRVRKVKRVETAHFILQTDSRAALGKFRGSLEEVHDFVVKTLGLPPMKATLPIYIFANAKGYGDFCVNWAGYTQEKAEHTAGHGCARYFATYFTQPRDPVVVHELAHSMVHRTLGPHGGSWLHEGFAVYAECAFEKKDAAEDFRVSLRNGNFTPLAEFFRIQSLAFVEAKKDSSKASRLYLQAGAFFAFLKKGPLADKFETLIKTLTGNFTEAEDRGKIIEKILGMPLDQLEKRWVTWGTGKRK